MSERKMTDADIAEMVKQFHEMHVCRFKDVEPEDMSFMKDLLAIYKETRSEVIKWIVKGVISLSFITLAAVAYFKVKGLK